MRTQDSATSKDDSSGQDVGLCELTSSMIRFTNAVTLFSMQQMQNAPGTVTDSQALIDRFCGALDAISNTLSRYQPSQISTQSDEFRLLIVLIASSLSSA